MQRVQKLPEYPRELDLNAAEVAWFARAQRARQVERVLHRSLAPYSVDPGHFGAGCTEWFSAPGIVLARRMMGLLSASASGSLQPCLVPLCDKPNLPESGVGPLLARSALDAWYRVEDLWNRLLARLPLAVQADREVRRLYWIGLRRLEQIEVLRLRAVALDLDTYEWHEDGRRRSLLVLMDWEGDDLLLQLTPSRLLQRWLEGEALDDLMRGFIARHAMPRNAAATASRPTSARTR